MTKRVFTAFLAIAVLFAAAPLAFAAPAESRMLGDVNGNGKIDAGDYAMTKRHYLNTYKLNDEQLFRADINGNKKVDASEYAMIKRHYLGTYVIKQPETQHEHVFGEWITETAPTCTEPGTRTHSCTVCGYTETEPVEAPGHDWDEDGICTRCGKQRTNGVFRFKLNEDGNSYTLTGAILNHLIDTDIIIPSTYKGLPVTSIGERALCSHTYIKSVIIPDSVTSIGAEAFSCCDSLKSVTIPGSVTDIGEKAFEWCDSLESIAVPGSVTSIGSYAFAYCPGLKRADFLNCAINIPDHAFIYCSSLESVTLGD
ncbi:MAG: leucine-rich repeat protein, partial [Clostridia bacterium]|nr:leucine-rich repeat protein [Clostridia bacterium]